MASVTILVMNMTTTSIKLSLLLLLLVCVLYYCASVSSAATRRTSSSLSSSSSSSKTTARTTSVKFETSFYTQTLDHFNYRPESYATFQQRYFISSKYWGGPNTTSPIFAVLGAETPLYENVGAGFLSDRAPEFKALTVFIEHRYYGKSIPFGGSRKNAFRDAKTLGYFSSVQALADYAELLLNLKKNLSAESSPVIVFGGSYGGLLATWFRLKYPHVALGALASSAPILYFEDFIPHNKGYYSIVSKDFREDSKTCFDTIRKSWDDIDRIAAEPNGVAVLSHIFKTCSPLTTSGELKDFLVGIYADAAQYSYSPIYSPVSMICDGINSADETGDGQSTLNRIFAGVVALMEKPCYNTSDGRDPEIIEGWNWLICTELINPTEKPGGKDSMFQPSTFNLEEFFRSCKKKYGVLPRPHWIHTEFGGHDLKLVLEKFGSNIIFSNGLKDPTSGGGVLESISGSVVAITTTEGSHCLDLNPKTFSDPTWLTEMQDKEFQIIGGWINEYNNARSSSAAP